MAVIIDHNRCFPNFLNSLIFPMPFKWATTHISCAVLHSKQRPIGLCKCDFGLKAVEGRHGLGGGCEYMQ